MFYRASREPKINDNALVALIVNMLVESLNDNRRKEIE